MAEKEMSNRTSGSGRRERLRDRRVHLADAWLPDLGDERSVSRRPWGTLSSSERRSWLIKAVLLAALTLTLVLHPSSAFRDVVVWASFLAVLFLKRRVLFSRKPDQLSLAILVYALVVAASVAYSAHREWSVRDGLKFFQVLAMVFAAWHLFKSRTFLFGFLQLLIGALLVVWIRDVVTYLGGLGRLWEWGERWVHGPYYGHPNTASAIIMILLPPSAVLFFASRSLWLKGMHALFIALGLFLMYVMASRTAQLSLVAVVVSGAFLFRPRKKRIIAAAVVGVALILGFFNIRALNPRFLDETVRTLTFRDENWRNLGKLIAKRPLVGYGYGKRNYQTVYHRTFRGSPVPYQHAHSQVLQIAFENGAVGLAASLWLWAVTLLRLLRGYAANRNRWGVTMGALLVSFLGMSVYCLAEVLDGFLRYLFWFLIAMAGASAAAAPDRKPLPGDKVVG